MSVDLLRQIAGELNNATDAAGRASRVAALVMENNGLVADFAVQDMPFDSSPYDYQAWLIAADKC